MSEDYYGGPEAGSPERLTLNQIKSIVGQEIEDSIGGLGSTISEQQRYAMRMYQGRAIGNEVKDRSQVVSMDVLETIEWVMPSLMRVFTGGSRIFEYMPRMQHDPEAAKEAELNASNATEYINYLFMEELNGFQILYDWFKTALLEKNGILKVYWDERRYPEVLNYAGLTEEMLTQLLSDENVEPMTVDSTTEEIGGQTVTLYDATVRKWQVKKRVRIDGVPPEEFLISKRTTKLDDEAPFTAQRKKLTVSDLVAMGFPFEEVSNLPSDDMPEYAMGRVTRLSEDETVGSTGERQDKASRPIWVTDCYIRLDEDGDGYSELRNILIVGEGSMHVLDDQEAGMNPFVSICPIPTPYKFYGSSLADLVIDIQVLRTTILRQIMDHLYLSVNPRLGVVEGQVEYDDLLTVRPGGLVRARSADSIFPIELPQIPNSAFELYKGLEETRGNRTGVIAHGTEIDASSINSTASGMAQMMAEKAQKVELYSRIFANGMRQLGQKLLRLVIENDTKAQQVYMNGRWISVDPSKWDTEMCCEVHVGLGAGQAIERAANLEKIVAIQEKLIMSGNSDMATRENLFATASELVTTCGYKNAHKFFTSPEGKEPPPPQPDADMEKVRVEDEKNKAMMQLETQKLQLETLKLEMAQSKAQMDAQMEAAKQGQLSAYRFEEMQSKERVEMERIQMEERVRLGQQEATLEAARITARASSEEEAEYDG